jgi:predicted nucleic acid-binding protein
MWIAAICLNYGIPLATLNLKDYADFEAYYGLHIVKL